MPCTSLPYALLSQKGCVFRSTTRALNGFRNYSRNSVREMLGLTGSLNYYLCQGCVDMRKGIDSLAELVRLQMEEEPRFQNNVYLFFSKNRKTLKILHYERGGYVLYQKRLDSGKFIKPIFDEISKKYKIN
jgi:transposase